MTIENLRETWETLGRTDPLWAVLSDPAKRNNRWDPEQFFRTGETEIAALFDELKSRGLEVNRRRCLDFGCGVGRVTQALAASFKQVDGVDIAQSMIDRALRRNQYGDRCRYHLNARQDLRIFPDATFDFVYSMIVLQHMVPGLSEGYIQEFLRVLVPGGIAVFQVPSRFLGSQPLPSSRHQAKLRLISPVKMLRTQPRTTSVLTVEVMNSSPAVWPASAPIRVGNHWLDTEGQMVRNDDGRTALEQAVGPGEQLTVPLHITAPAKPGKYILEVDVVEEGVTWFATRGSGTLRIDVDVSAPGLRSIALRHVQNITRQGRRVFSAAKQPDAPFEMHALPKDRVVNAVESAEGEILAIEDNDASGPGWENYRYFVRKRVPPGRLR